MNILAVIPARGGSKGVPRKNIHPVCGAPLIKYTIDAALAARHLLQRTIVTTDDAEIAAVARTHGADVPFLRPAELAVDAAPTLPALEHAVRFAEDQGKLTYDWVLLLQPTSPLRTAQDIEASIALAAKGGCDSVISVVESMSSHPAKMKRIEHDQLLPYCLMEKEGARRQDLQPPAYKRNGAIYLTRRDVLMKQHSIWGATIRPYVMPAERSVDVDSELDLKLVTLLLQERGS